MSKIFFDSWDSILRILIIGVFAYGSLVFLLRISGKRTLSKMNAFDFIVTIALGSTLATVLIDKSIPLVDGVFALSLLVGLQYIITWLAVRLKTVSNLVKSTPTLLVYKGRMFPDAMRKERINEDEIFAIIRQMGLSSVEEAGAVVLETDGTLTVVKEIKSLDNKTMGHVEKPSDAS